MGEIVCVCTPDEGFPSFFGQMRLCWCLAWLPLWTLAAFSTDRTRSSYNDPCHLIEPSIHSPLRPIHYAGLVVVVFVCENLAYFIHFLRHASHRALLTSPRPHRHILCRSLVLSVPIYIALYCHSFFLPALFARCTRSHCNSTKWLFPWRKMNYGWCIERMQRRQRRVQRPPPPIHIKYEKLARSRSLRERSCWKRK